MSEEEDPDSIEVWKRQNIVVDRNEIRVVSRICESHVRENMNGETSESKTPGEWLKTVLSSVITFDQNQYLNIFRRPYIASFKADGERMLLVRLKRTWSGRGHDTDVVYLWDKTGNLYKSTSIRMKNIPQTREREREIESPLFILDGELMVKDDKGYYLTFDMLWGPKNPYRSNNEVIIGDSANLAGPRSLLTGPHPYASRIDYARILISFMYGDDYSRPWEPTASQGSHLLGVRIFVKPYSHRENLGSDYKSWCSSEVDRMLPPHTSRTIRNFFKNNIDGIILTPLDSPSPVPEKNWKGPGITQYKWKPVPTIDASARNGNLEFTPKRRAESREIVRGYLPIRPNGPPRLEYKNKNHPKRWGDIKEYRWKIINGVGQWIAIKDRIDKDRPNSTRTVENIVLSINPANGKSIIEFRDLVTVMNITKLKSILPEEWKSFLAYCSVIHHTLGIEQQVTIGTTLGYNFPTICNNYDNPMETVLKIGTMHEINKNKRFGSLTPFQALSFLRKYPGEQNGLIRSDFRLYDLSNRSRASSKEKNDRRFVPLTNRPGANKRNGRYIDTLNEEEMAIQLCNKQEHTDNPRARNKYIYYVNFDGYPHSVWTFRIVFETNGDSGIDFFNAEKYIEINCIDGLMRRSHETQTPASLTDQDKIHLNKLLFNIFSLIT